MHKHKEIFNKLSDSGVRQVDIAAACEVTPAAVARWVNGVNWRGKDYDPSGIPLKHCKSIVDLAKSRGVKLSLADFKKIEIDLINEFFDSLK